jgi:hypothetical protein
MRFRPAIRLAVVTTILLVATSVAHAQQGEDLREVAQNPIADLISVPFQNNTNFDIGHTDNTQNVLNRPSRFLHRAPLLTKRAFFIELVKAATVRPRDSLLPKQ